MNAEKHLAAESEDAVFMALALAQAAQAAQQGEVPIGAVLVRGGQVVAQAHNAPVAMCDPTAHAEILALRRAAQQVANYRLTDCTLYVTAEPCTMCAGAIVNARLARVVYAVDEPRTGAAGSQIDVLGNPGLNAHTQVTRGVLADEARAQLQAFFAQRRQSQRQARLPLREDALRLSAAGLSSLQAEQQAAMSAALAAWRSAQGVEVPPESRPAGVGMSFTVAKGQVESVKAGNGGAMFMKAQQSDGEQARDAGKDAGEWRSCWHWMRNAANNTGFEFEEIPWRLHHWTFEPVQPAYSDHATAFVHGWAEQAPVWRHWAAQVAVAGQVVVLPDLLGHGLSDKPRKPEAAALLNLVSGVLDQLQASRWGEAAARSLVLDASLLPLLVQHAEQLGLNAPFWQAVRWCWVKRASACDAANAAKAKRTRIQPDDLHRPLRPGFPAQLAGLRKLLVQTGQEEAAGWAAAFPDAGHLGLLRCWLSWWAHSTIEDQSTHAMASRQHWATQLHHWLDLGEGRSPQWRVIGESEHAGVDWKSIWPRMRAPSIGGELPALGQPLRKADWPGLP